MNPENCGASENADADLLSPLVPRKWPAMVMSMVLCMLVQLRGPLGICEALLCRAVLYIMGQSSHGHPTS
jgi:hypothetical protein